MAAQLKDLAFKLKKIGGVQTLDSWKKKKLSDSGSHGNDFGSTGLVADPVLVETVPSAEEENLEAGGEALKRRKIGEPVYGDTSAPAAVVEKPPLPGSSVGASIPRNLKEWIASIPAADRR